MHEKRPNPKKDKSARRKRNPLYWQTGGRQRITMPSCRDCLQAMKRTRNSTAMCGDCYRAKEKINVPKTDKIKDDTSK